VNGCLRDLETREMLAQGSRGKQPVGGSPGMRGQKQMQRQRRRQGSAFEEKKNRAELANAAVCSLRLSRSPGSQDAHGRVCACLSTCACVLLQSNSSYQLSGGRRTTVSRTPRKWALCPSQSSSLMPAVNSSCSQRQRTRCGIVDPLVPSCRSLQPVG